MGLVFINMTSKAKSQENLHNFYYIKIQNFSRKNVDNC